MSGGKKYSIQPFAREHEERNKSHSRFALLAKPFASDRIRYAEEFQPSGVSERRNKDRHTCSDYPGLPEYPKCPEARGLSSFAQWLDILREYRSPQSICRLHDDKRYPRD